MSDQSTETEDQGEQEENEQEEGGLGAILEELPLDGLKDALQEAVSTLIESAGDRISDATDKLAGIGSGDVTGKAAKGGAESMAEGDSPLGGALKGGLSGVWGKVKGVFGGGDEDEEEEGEDEDGGGGGGGGSDTKVINIIEDIDVGVPVSVAYNAWTEFQEYSGFMKKVDNVDQEDETQVNFKAQVFWSHREWKATIVEQVPDEKIVWRSKGKKGHVDGTVTFHELAPNLTRILVVLEYYPQGLFERTGNLWRAQGRRARLELKHFRRHVMTNVIVEPDEVEGWRGEIRDSEVERSHDEVVDEEEQEAEEDAPEDEEAEYEDEAPEDEEAEYEDEDEVPEDEEAEYDDEAPEDEVPEDEEAEYEDEEVPEDEEAEYEDEAPEDDAVEDEEEDEKPRRRRKSRSR
jgi:hypothetical protein